MIESLKLLLINWLGLATKAELKAIHEDAIAHANELHKLVVPLAKSVVITELDRDERTLVMNIEVSAPVQLDTDKLKVAIAKAIQSYN